MNADGTDQKRLTNDARADYRPAYSPDGNQIAFVRDRGGTPNIYVMDSDGGNVVRLTNHGGLEPAWSPDGSKIAYSIHDGIYVMNADGSGSRQLTSAQDKEPAWSPDGKSIVFSNNGRDNYHSIWLMRADGLDVRRFLGGAYSRTNPDWSPDGRNIAFDDRDCWDYGPCPRGIVIGTIEEQYSIVLDDASEPAWRPH